PGIPARRHPAAVVGTVIDHPPAAGVLAVAEIDVAGLVAARFLAIAARNDAGAPGGAVPPGKGVCEDSHDDRAFAALPPPMQPAWRYHSTLSPGLMPSSAARPPAISSTALTG